MKNLWRFINRPLPGWFTLFLFAGALASAAAVLPDFSSGTASFGLAALSTWDR